MNRRHDKHRESIRLPLLGCIADDFTGATDLAGVLVKNGMRTIVTLSIPDRKSVSNVDAVVIALKSRNAALRDAVKMSLAALRWLRNSGCRQFFFKYCSTFDSTSKGNIGPVAEALMAALRTKFTIACPAFPANRRTVYNGYLFVNDRLLEESGMESHPLNPMTDSDLVRLLQAQSVGKVSLIGYSIVGCGATCIAQALTEARARESAFVILDAISEANLRDIALACQDLPLLTGASGLAIGIPDTFRSQGLLESGLDAELIPSVPGLSAIISGSCSEATQRQVAWIEDRMPTLKLDPLSAAADSELSAKSVQWARLQMPDGPVLITTTANAASVKASQRKLGTEGAALLAENLLAEIAHELVKHGVRRLIIAGGETSGAVLKRLRVQSLRVGPQIDPGVHWSISDGKVRLALALKSGNFGGIDFFNKAWGLLS
jgi:uncharacterized protein YgbK (DUF1537 family)